MKKIDLHIHTIATEKDSNFIFDIEKMLYYTLYSEFYHPKQSILQ